MRLPADYLERVYAGVLGKIIGVYLGRPFEGWPYRRILKELGPIEYYVHERLGVPLIVPDDDISGTFTFVRALEDYAEAGKDLTAAQIGECWLNYIIENRTILWWGGMGMSTEHTAFNRLKSGIPAPRSGSIELNSQVVAEQIGAQIFIDAWAMVAPGQPDLAVALARRAGSVSHDGEAVYAAQVLAAMESQAFVESNLDRLLDLGVSFIPNDSVIYRMIGDLREFHAKEKDWQRAMIDVMERHYGYDKFGGNCHVVPNHGLIVLALLYGKDDFQRSLMIANTCGWDTDCNSGNVGCLMGIKNGLAGIDRGPDWRGPVADRLLLPTADGGSCITDAVTQAHKIVNIGRRLAGEPVLSRESRFDFSLPDSVQGFIADESSIDSKGVASVSNARGMLRMECRGLAAGRVGRIGVATFLPPTANDLGGYGVQACPTISSGQTIAAMLRTESPVTCRLFARIGSEPADAEILYGPASEISPESEHTLTWPAPDCEGRPIYEVGLEVLGESGANATLDLLNLTWSGVPNLTLNSSTKGEGWKRQWVDGVDHFQRWGKTDETSQAFVAIQDKGRGLAIHGTRDWTDYAVSATFTPHLIKAGGLAVRVQGMRRYYALLMSAGNRVRLVKVLDGEHVLAEASLRWRQNDDPHNLRLVVENHRIYGYVDGELCFDNLDEYRPLTEGAIAIVVEEGRLAVSPVTIQPV